MTVATRVRPMRMLSWAGLGVAVAMSIPTASTQAADAADEGSLCDTITIEELNALGPLQFEPPEFFSGANICAFGPADSSDSYTLYLTVSGFSLEDMRTAAEAEPDFVEVLVGDQPAIMAGGDLHVGLDEGILSVGVDPDDAGGIDPVEYIVDIAEIVVPALAAAPASDAGGEVTVARPPDVEGIDWRGGQSLSRGQDLMEDENQAALWQPLLDATGAEPAQLVLLNVSAFDDADERLGQYDAIRVAGSDPASFRSALIEWLRTASGGEDASFEDRTLGGKDVVSFSVGGELAGYLYFAGDTAHALTMPEEHAARVLEALP